MNYNHLLYLNKVTPRTRNGEELGKPGATLTHSITYCISCEKCGFHADISSYDVYGLISESVLCLHHYSLIKGCVCIGKYTINKDTCNISHEDYKLRSLLK